MGCTGPPLASAVPGVSAQLERVALESYVRGLSTRDVEEAFRAKNARNQERTWD